MHEDHDYYTKCKYRNRNKGLFTADRVSMKYSYSLWEVAFPFVNFSFCF